MMKPENRMTRVFALLLCLPLLLALMLPARAKTYDPDNLTGFVIFEDPELLGDVETDECNPDATTEAPTEVPTEAPTQEPTPTPVPPTPPPTAAYDISMPPPTGWYASRAAMEITVTDQGGTGWENIKVIQANAKGTVTLVNGPLPSGHLWIDLLDNGTIQVIVTDPYGEAHSKQVDILCFDREAPSLSASIQGEYLRMEASDKHSGIAAVSVNGTKYSELTEGKLEISLRQYADSYEQVIVQAVDKVGNVSKAIALANPFYRHNATPKPTTTPKPTATPKPTQQPPSGGGGNGSGGTGSGKNPTPTAKPTATPTAEPTTIPTAPPTQMLPQAEPGSPYSQNGNAYTRDLLYDKFTNKQFIVIETRNGDVFYMVIDYDKPLDAKGERYETYFLNLVDNRDLLDIVGAEDVPKEPEVIYVTPAPTTQPTAVPMAPEVPPKNGGSGAALGLVGILLAAAGGALWYFKLRKPSSGKPKSSFEDYEFGDDDGEDDEPLENEDE